MKQEVVYSILKKLLNYPRIAKFLDYKKKATIIFPKVKQLVQQFQLAITEQKKIWESITLVVALNLLYDNFEIMITLFLYPNNKDLKKIQQIITSIKAANLAKQTVGATTDLAIIAKKTVEKVFCQAKNKSKMFQLQEKKLLRWKLPYIKQKKAQRFIERSQPRLGEEKSS